MKNKLGAVEITSDVEENNVIEDYWMLYIHREQVAEIFNTQILYSVNFQYSFFFITTSKNWLSLKCS